MHFIRPLNLLNTCQCWQLEFRIKADVMRCGYCSRIRNLLWQRATPGRPQVHIATDINYRHIGALRLGHSALGTRFVIPSSSVTTMHRHRSNPVFTNDDKCTDLGTGGAHLHSKRGRAKVRFLEYVYWWRPKALNIDRFHADASVANDAFVPFTRVCSNVHDTCVFVAVSLTIAAHLKSMRLSNVLQAGRLAKCINYVQGMVAGTRLLAFIRINMKRATVRHVPKANTEWFVLSGNVQRANSKHTFVAAGLCDVRRQSYIDGRRFPWVSNDKSIYVEHMLVDEDVEEGMRMECDGQLIACNTIRMSQIIMRNQEVIIVFICISDKIIARSQVPFILKHFT